MIVSDIQIWLHEIEVSARVQREVLSEYYVNNFVT